MNMVPTRGYSQGHMEIPDNTTCDQIVQTIVDRRHCTNVCDGRSIRCAEPESRHFLVRAKITLKIKRSKKTTNSEI